MLPAESIEHFSSSIDQLAARIDKEKLEKAQQSDEAKNKWKNIPVRIQQMIILASSTLDVIFALHPAPTLLETLQQGKVVQAQMVLNRMLKDINCQVDVPLSLVTALFNGSLSPPSNQVTHVFSISMYHLWMQQTWVQEVIWIY